MAINFMDVDASMEEVSPEVDAEAERIAEMRAVARAFQAEVSARLAVNDPMTVRFRQVEPTPSKSVAAVDAVQSPSKQEQPKRGVDLMDTKELALLTARVRHDLRIARSAGARSHRHEGVSVGGGVVAPPKLGSNLKPGQAGPKAGI